jgi:hypothetical protein
MPMKPAQPVSRIMAILGQPDEAVSRRAAGGTWRRGSASTRGTLPAGAVCAWSHQPSGRRSSRVISSQPVPAARAGRCSATQAATGCRLPSQSAAGAAGKRVRSAPASMWSAATIGPRPS